MWCSHEEVWKLFPKGGLNLVIFLTWFVWTGSNCKLDHSWPFDLICKNMWWQLITCRAVDVSVRPFQGQYHTWSSTVKLTGCMTCTMFIMTPYLLTPGLNPKKILTHVYLNEMTWGQRFPLSCSQVTVTGTEGRSRCTTQTQNIGRIRVKADP